MGDNAARQRLEPIYPALVQHDGEIESRDEVANAVAGRLQLRHRAFLG